MAVIRPSAELRNNYNEISRICHETQQPVYITKNGANDLVVLSNEAYEKNEDTRIQKKVEEIFNKKYLDLEGKYTSAKQAFKELEEKYDL